MIVQAKCIQRCWDSTAAQLYVPNGGPLPGGLYELDLSNPAHRKLVDLKANWREFVFQFDRKACNDAASGMYFCEECSTRFETLNSIGNHMKQIHKRTGWGQVKEEPEPEVAEAEETGPTDLRGLGPRHCKDCGQAFPHVNALVQHKKTCPGKPPGAPTPQAESQEVGQAPPA